MKGVCVIGIDRKRLLATDLRIERSTGSHMTEAGLMECVRRRGGGTLR